MCWYFNLENAWIYKPLLQILIILLFWKIFLSWVAFCGSHVSHFMSVNMKCIINLSYAFPEYRFFNSVLDRRKWRGATSCHIIDVPLCPLCPMSFFIIPICPYEIINETVTLIEAKQFLSTLWTIRLISFLVDVYGIVTIWTVAIVAWISYSTATA